jgi:hypothetical protein
MPRPIPARIAGQAGQERHLPAQQVGQPATGQQQAAERQRARAEAGVERDLAGDGLRRDEMVGQRVAHRALVMSGCRVHDAMVKGWQVKPHHQDPVTAGLACAAGRSSR